MPAGAPTKYRDHMIKDALGYVDGGYAEKGQAIPTMAGLAFLLGIHKDTLNEWRKDPDKEKLSVIIDKLDNLQEVELVSKGLKGEYNPTIAKVLLGKHGYSDKQEVTGKDGQPLTPPTLVVKFHDDQEV